MEVREGIKRMIVYSDHASFHRRGSISFRTLSYMHAERMIANDSITPKQQDDLQDDCSRCCKLVRNLACRRCEIMKGRKRKW